MIEPPAVPKLSDVFELHKFTNYNIVTATAWLGYEIVVTSSQEIKYIWKSPWSAVKVLYLLVRYYSILYLLITSFVTTNTFLSANFCRQYLFFSVWGCSIIFPIVDLLIVARLYALYNGSKRMGIVLAALWLTEITCGFTLIGIALRPLNGATIILIPGRLIGCNSPNSPNYGLSLGAQGVWCTFQAIYVAITMFKLVSFVRTFGFSFSPVLNVFFRDGAAYFLTILVINLFAMFGDKFGSILLQESGPSWHWQVAVASVTACRLILNIRHTAAPKEVIDPDATLTSNMRSREEKGHGQSYSKLKECPV